MPSSQVLDEEEEPSIEVTGLNKERSRHCKSPTELQRGGGGSPPKEEEEEPQEERDRILTGSKSYAMTSEELVDTKLEAFETRMEDKLRALLVEFIQICEGIMLTLDKPWSCDHRCKKERFLMIEPIEGSEVEDTDLESEKEDTKEDP
ncbi:hypothetical protein B296_00011120 [Ensete ventricosum]|uniref:Uncharacterized protein n=1 Tax=Ensete ventricosum TaxID=4639 RepID=A0A427B7N8_ENSVE|nr:hypothetical protein B296_00011120 [Ensete ventricosum]